MVPRNARRRESKGSQGDNHLPQLRNNNSNNCQQQQQHYRNNNERRSKWNRNAAPFHPSGGQATGLTADPAAESGHPDDLEEFEDVYELGDQAEWDSVMVQGSKKHNLNHLLNFHYTPRERPPKNGSGGGKDQTRSAKSSAAATFYNKDQFLQAK